MINKINNINFKGIYPLASMQTIDFESLTKLRPVINMDEEFPHNDIYLGLTPKNHLLVDVFEKDNSEELLEPEVLNATEFTTRQLIGMVDFIKALKSAYNQNHPENSVRLISEYPINKMSMFDMALTVNDAVQKFNEKFSNKGN